MRVVALGEAMIRLSPPDHIRIEQTSIFEVQVGGAELNAAAGVVRMGYEAEWISALPQTPLGRLVHNAVRGLGVGTQFLVWKPEGRVGLYFIEHGASPRPSRVVYDRAGSCASMLGPADVDWARAFADAVLFHTSGITPALSDSAAQTVEAALRAAKAAGLRVTYDLNYRGSLWPPEKARRVQEPFMQYVDVLITSEACAEVVLGVREATPAATARRLAERYGFEVVAITLRETPSILRNRVSAMAFAGGQIIQDDWYEVEIVDRVGAGDAFTAGFICGYLEGDLERAVRLGNAMCALKHTMVGDMCWAEREEVEQLLAGGSRFTITR